MLIRPRPLRTLNGLVSNPLPVSVMVKPIRVAVLFSSTTAVREPLWRTTLLRAS